MGYSNKDSFFDKLIATGLILLVCLIPLVFFPYQIGSASYPLFYIYLLPKALALRIGTIFLLILIGIKTLWRRRLSLQMDRLDLSLLAFLLLSTLSIERGLNKEQALTGSPFWLEGFYTYLNYAAIFFIARAYLNEKTIIKLSKVLIVTTMIISALAIIEMVFPEQVATFSTLPIVGRSGSTAGNAAILGAYLAMPLALIASFLAFKLYQPYKKLWPYLATISLVLGIVAAILTYSRGAWIASFFAAIVIVGSALRWRLLPARKILLGFLAIFIIALLLVAIIPSPSHFRLAPRALSGFDPEEVTVKTRLKLWQETIKMIPEYFLFGIGFDNYEYALSQRTKEAALLRANKPHNYFLEIWLYLGTVAFFAYLLFYFLLFHRAFKFFKKSEEMRGRGLIAGLIIAILSYLIAISFLFSTINSTPLFFALLGMSASLM